MFRKDKRSAIIAAVRKGDMSKARNIAEYNVNLKKTLEELLTEAKYIEKEELMELFNKILDHGIDENRRVVGEKINIVIDRLEDLRDKNDDQNVKNFATEYIGHIREKQSVMDNADPNKFIEDNYNEILNGKKKKLMKKILQYLKDSITYDITKNERYYSNMKKELVELASSVELDAVSKEWIDTF